MAGNGLHSSGVERKSDGCEGAAEGGDHESRKGCGEGHAAVEVSPQGLVILI